MPSVSLVNLMFRPACAHQGRSLASAGLSPPVGLFNGSAKLFNQCRNDLSSNAVGNCCYGLAYLTHPSCILPNFNCLLVCESHRRPVICGIICSRHPIVSGSSIFP
ncbi:hypothetical protein HDV57DRAFT_170964 [Trichoderma longibrachiatum]|uniref:Uncharacterized protein n=1 Tax=Trichoderma longibrachiatum ATCC 18648 TaxID=983965 RepID=A0A2T4CAA0_TRILO|nr:hypothetical protein M440DRAFT_1194499 [Trichoderma longibrachiatum ATCC 18648]